LPSFIDQDPGTAPLWIGKSCTTPLHHDVMNSLLCQIVGTKHFRLVSPDQFGKLDHRHGLQSNLSYFSWLSDEEAERRGIAYQDFVIHAGEALFLPVGWWHCVRTFEPSITAAFGRFRWDQKNWFGSSFEALMKTAQPRMCLNMIVRDEVRIVGRLLESVASHIDTFVILDTGSTDGTVELIQQWANRHNIRGEVHRSEFIDFSTSRNLALDFAARSSIPWDYLLLLDADFEFRFSDPNWRATLTEPVYRLPLRRHEELLARESLLHRTVNARYYGRTHEVLKIDAPSTLNQTIGICDHDDGSSHDVKLARDLALLELDLQDDSADGRAMFYLGAARMAMGDRHGARELWARRVQLPEDSYRTRWRALSLLRPGDAANA
jgi:hypothetical protein